MGKKRGNLPPEYVAWLDGVRVRMRAEREELGLSYRGAEERTGVPFGSISRLEAGRIMEPTLELLWRLAVGYGIPISRFLCESTPKPTPKRRKK